MWRQRECQMWRRLLVSEDAGFLLALIKFDLGIILNRHLSPRGTILTMSKLFYGDNQCGEQFDKMLEGGKRLEIPMSIEVCGPHKGGRENTRRYFHGILRADGESGR